MPQSEFEIIRKFFSQQGPCRDDVVLGTGDDCALLKVPQNHQLAVSTDTLVSGVHFPLDTSAADIGYKSLAVNLSDLAAMGAEPAWVTLALTLPDINESWLSDFSQAFFSLAKEYNVQLVGGDMTRGPLSINVHVSGFIPHGTALTRHGARAGDSIFVSGCLGDAGLGLLVHDNKIALAPQQSLLKQQALNKLNRPTPRVHLGMAIREIASAAIDISDGFAADLNHLLSASACGAKIVVEQLPLSEELLVLKDQLDIYSLALSAGDDYELCFTVGPNNIKRLTRLTSQLGLAVHKVGKIEDSPGLRLESDGHPVQLSHFGFDHFKSR